MKMLHDKVQQLQRMTPCIVPGDKLLIACSGGVDSMALLHYLHREHRRLQVDIAAVYVDHMLRGEQSRDDGRFVAAFCAQHDIPFYSRAIHVPHALAEHGGNVQQLCRTMRYSYFEELMPQFTKLVTAHHADDQLETMLMSLTKGSSIAALSGIRVMRPFANGHVIRPFLFVTRAQIDAYMAAHDLTHREDPSNEKDTYTRNRLRHHVTPLLKAENEQATLHAAQLAMQLQQDDALLMDMAAQYVRTNCEKLQQNLYTFKIKALQKMPLALQRRFILILLNYVYKDVNMLQSYTLTTALLKLCNTTEGNAQLSLPNGFVARRQYGELFIGDVQHEYVTQQPIVTGQWVRAAKYEVSLMKAGTSVLPTDDVYYISLAEQEQLYVRSRKQGDRMLLYGMESAKKVSRIFIDEKVPQAHREAIPLLVSSERGVLAIIGVRASAYVSRLPQNHQWQLVIRTIALQ